MPRINRKVCQITLYTVDLQQLTKAQRQLLLTLGHVANEMAAIYRAAHAAGSEARVDADLTTRLIARSQTLLMLRLGASKMQEFFDITNASEYGKIIQSVIPTFVKEKKEIEKIVEAHIGLRVIRNEFGFHYKANMFSKINMTYLSLPAEECYNIVFEIGGKVNNTFFAISEAFFQKTFAAAMNDNPSYKDFAVAAIFDLVKAIMIALDRCIAMIQHIIIGLLRSAGIDPNVAERHQEATIPFTPADEVRLPAFVFFPPKRKEQSDSTSQP
jgi:hypothetical protein